MLVYNSDIDERFMTLTLELAGKGRGKVEPNPMVGAVLVKNGEIIGKGYHHVFGGAHAEINAINEASDKCKGAILYVSMEPCAHFGKTAPCVDAIIKAGIARVVIAVTDPNPITSGKGIKKLKEAGIKVKTGIMELQAEKINAPFFKLMQKGLPYIIVKWAMSLDGKISTHTGDSKWITSEESRNYVQSIRGQMDGVMVGINTVMRDDPLLTCRHKEGKNPKRIVVDSRSSLPLNSRLLKTVCDSDVIVAVNMSAPEERIKRLEQFGCKIVCTNNLDGRVDLKELFKNLAQMNMTNILVEGGGRIITSVFEHKLADKLMVFIAPIIIGGERAISPVLGNGIKKVSEAAEISEVIVKRFSNDTLIEGILKYK